ncbi:MAG: hypothetical protein ABII79_05765 [bacterium]
MKKAVLAIVFLGLLTAVCYYRANTQKQQKESAYQLGLDETSHVVEEYDSRLDSQRQVIQQQQHEVAESLWVRELAYRNAFDSLQGIITTNQEKMDTLSHQLDQARSPAKEPESTEQVSRRKATKHEQILSYYRKRLKNLPGDLSPYEKNVALREIRGETVQKFSISMRDLDKIRKDNHLDN